jgi:glycosyltransferase involved in cell wall biosynthesis
MAFVAPLPPPVHGFSNICAAMLERLAAGTNVAVFDRARGSTGGLKARIRPLGNFIKYCIWSAKTKGGGLYVGLSGGLGQLVDWPYILIARAFGQRIFVHHHTFAYIDAPSMLSRSLFVFLRDQTHIALSRRMGSELSRIYRLNSSKVRVISNAAFYEGTDVGRPRTANQASSPLRLGFLSNITFEKGFVEFFGILAELRRRGIAYSASIAGPVSAPAKQRFDELLAGSSNVQYVGAVYGAAKVKFYENLDIFIFPTNYVNEAEPLVVFEALRSGVHVIACNRGAIPEMLDNGAGLVFARDDLVEAAAAEIEKFSRQRAALARAQELSLEQAKRIRTAAAGELERVMSLMQGEP